ncbi:HPP family protein [Streptomyces sp. CC77]|uniref:CBS domain-containing protein n=1 Tax=Streptomyces sp. CC77 TaxID=1906739 RepID=UPI0008DC85D7|nr:CBS domain-containing protein [Streptomyces sp. CC77]OII66783.1 hypothetical protein BJP39_07920 [Streptomyces sp. CC77]
METVTRQQVPTDTSEGHVLDGPSYDGVARPEGSPQAGGPRTVGHAPYSEGAAAEEGTPYGEEAAPARGIPHGEGTTAAERSPRGAGAPAAARRDGRQDADDTRSSEHTEDPGRVAVLDRPVGTVMRTPVVAVAAGETVLVAWELLERTRARHLPVVRPDGRCAGVLERAEVAVACAAPAVALSRRYAGDLLRSRRCAVVHQDDPVRRAVDVMYANDCDVLPVVADAGRLVGLVGAADLVSALAGRPAGAGPAVPCPYPVMPGLPPRRDDERVSPVP